MRRELGLKCVLLLFLVLLLETRCQLFFPVSIVTFPEVFAKVNSPQFLLISKVSNKLQ